MAQHDYNIANQSGADFRADLNNALLAIATVNSGSTEPSTTFAHQLWVDTSSSVLKIRNAADNAWITTGVSITTSNTFTGNLTGDVTGNLTGNVTGNVTGDLTGNADSADTLSTARTISLSGDVVGSVSFDGSANIDIDTVVQINSITLGTDTTGDYVESMSGGTGVTVTGGTGEGSTPSIAIGQAVAATDDVTFNIITATEEFIGDLEGGIRFNAKADGALSKGDVVYISGVSGDVPTVGQAKADDASKMPAFGLALSDANDNAALQVVTFGTIEELDTSGVSEGQILYVSTTAGAYTTTAPTGESSQIQNIGKVIRSHASAGSIKVGGAGRSNATPNLDNGKIFIGNGSNQSVTSTLDTSIVVENTNLYYTTARANTDFDSRLATKDTGDLTEGTNLYYTTARVNSDFDTRLATKDTGDLTEGSNLYYTDARVNSAFDTRLATKDTDDVSEGTTNLYYTTSRTNTDFDTRLATKSTTNLAEGTNLYYTTARFDSAFTSKDTDDLSEGSTNLYYTQSRFDSAFGNKTTADLTENTNLYYTDTRANSAIDARVTKAFVDALGIQATSVAADSVALGTDTTGNYVSTITGTANKITVSGSGSESANITLSLPDDVQIASDLTVAGNLTVNGTLTSLDTTNLDIEDNLFQLNAGLTGSPVNDSGMLINRGTADNGIFMWDESVDKFTLGLTTADGSATGNITLNSLGTLVANLEGAVTGTVSSLSNHDTDDLAEGSNLYYTDARSRSAISATGDISYNSSTGVISFTQSASPVTSVNTQTGAVVLDTDDVGEGSTNVYFTNARADTRINLQTGANLDLSSKSTSDLSEGSNLYYTDARVQAVSINNVVEDTTPQLGGDLDLNSNDITGTGDINITGTVTADGLTVDGTATFNTGTGTTNNFIITGTDAGGSTAPDLVLFRDSASPVDGDNIGMLLFKGNNDAGTSVGYAGIFATINDASSTTEDGKLNFSVATANTESPSGGTTFMTIEGGGDISFYEDTGTTAKFFWDASAERLGIGTTSPTDKLDVAGTVVADGLTVDGNILAGTTTIPTGLGASNTKLILSNDSDSPEVVVYRNTNLIGAGDKVGAYLFGNDDNNATEDHFAGIWAKSSGTGGHMDILFAGGRDNYENDTSQMILTSDGNVGIGTDNPSNKLHVQTNTASLTNLINIDNIDSSGNGGALAFTQNSSLKGRIKSYFGSGAWTLGFDTEDTTDALTIIDNGNVGIGTTSPAAPLDVAGNFIFKSPANTLYGNFDNTTAGYGAFRLQNLGSSYGFIGQTSSLLASGGSNTALGLRSENEFAIATGGSTERMRIDSSGNLLVGQTAASSGTVGTSLRADGRTFFCADGNYAAHFNRNTSDGAIVHFAKDDSIVGSIGASGGDLIVGTGDTGLYFYDGADTVIPWNITSNSARNGSIDLGASSHRFKDLHLSGTAYINTAVGIGTTSPQTDLNIVNTSGATLDINTNLVGADSKILLHEGSSSSPANGASIRYDGANNLFKIGVGSSVDTTRLTIARDTGNVGIGASSALDNKLEVNGGDIRVRGTSTPSIKFNNADQEVVAMRLQSGATGNLSFHTDKMVIDASGNVGIGTTSPTNALDINGSQVLLANGALKFADAGNAHIGMIKNSGSSGTGQLEFYTGSAPTERMRIDTSGNLIIGTTNSNPVNLADHRLVVELNSSTAGIAVGADGLVDSRQVMTFYNDNGTTGTIVTSGSSTAYNTSSDYRLKENVDYEFTALDRVAQLKPARFNFIADADNTVDGFLAHEVQDIVPEAISGEKDAVDDEGNPEYQGIDQSKLVPLLTKAIQEQQELINNLTARIEELEN